LQATNNVSEGHITCSPQSSCSRLLLKPVQVIHALDTGFILHKHASVLIVLLYLLPPPGTLYLLSFVTVPPYLVSAVNSKLFSINQSSSLCSTLSTHLSASDSVVFLWHCVLYKFAYLLRKTTVVDEYRQCRG